MSKMEGKTVFGGTYRLSGTELVDVCLEVIDVV